MACVDCGDEHAPARDRCDTCYRRALRTGEICRVLARVTNEEAATMRRMAAAGLSLGEVAHAVGRGWGTVRRHVTGSVTA